MNTLILKMQPYLSLLFLSSLKGLRFAFTENMAISLRNTKYLYLTLFLTKIFNLIFTKTRDLEIYCEITETKKTVFKTLVQRML